MSDPRDGRPPDKPPTRYRPLPGRPDVLVGSDGEGVWVRRKEEEMRKTLGDLLDEYEALSVIPWELTCRIEELAGGRFVRHKGKLYGVVESFERSKFVVDSLEADIVDASTIEVKE